MTKPTKEQLIVENEKLREEVKQLREQEKGIRGELSNALGSPDIPNYLVESGAMSINGYRQARSMYTWFEIFREIGKLLQRDQEQAQREEIQRLQSRIDEQNREFEEHARKFHPNQNPF